MFKYHAWARRSTTRTERGISTCIYGCTVLGAAFLWLGQGQIPPVPFMIIAAGWILFFVDSLLTLVRPRASFLLGGLLAGLGLAASLPQTAHYRLFESGQIVFGTIFLAGTVLQGILLVLALAYLVRMRRL